MLYCNATFEDSIHHRAIPDRFISFLDNLFSLNYTINEASVFRMRFYSNRGVNVRAFFSPAVRAVTPDAVFYLFIFFLPARNCDLHFGGGDVPRQRVELVDRSHVLEFVHDVSLHERPRLGAVPRLAEAFTVPLGPTRS